MKIVGISGGSQAEVQQVIEALMDRGGMIECGSIKHALSISQAIIESVDTILVVVLGSEYDADQARKNGLVVHILNDSPTESSKLALYPGDYTLHMYLASEKELADNIRHFIQNAL